MKIMENPIPASNTSNVSLNITRVLGAGGLEDTDSFRTSAFHPTSLHRPGSSLPGIVENVRTHVPLFVATQSVDEDVFLDPQADRDKRFIRFYGNHCSDPANSISPTSVMSDMPVRSSSIPPAQDGKLVEYPLPLPLPPPLLRIPILLQRNLYPDAGFTEPLMC